MLREPAGLPLGHDCVYGEAARYPGVHREGSVQTYPNVGHCYGQAWGLVVVIVVVVDFYFTSGARAWTRRVSWYFPCGKAVCIECSEFVACVCV